MEEKNFMKGAAILGFAGVIVKILGAIYRIPVGNILTDVGMGYYQTAYPFYMLLLTVSTVGFPVAIAKLVSERRAIGDHANAHKVFKVSLAGLSIVSVLTSAFVYFKAKDMVDALGNPNAYYALIALVPALFFTPIMSAFRGYFQGTQNMAPTAISQISEQLFRVIAGLFLTYYLVNANKGIPIAAGGMSLGGSIGSIAGTLTVYLIYLRRKPSIRMEIENSGVDDYYATRDIIRDLAVIAIPITLGSAITPIMDTIDTKLVLTRLQTINYSRAEANALFGQLKGFAQTLINLPQVFSIAIGMSLVPVISEANARKEHKKMNTSIESGIRMTLLIGLPATVGLFVLAKPIIQLLYFSNTAETIANTGTILRYLSLGVVFLTLVQVTTSIIQGLGRPMIPVLTLLLGAVAKIMLTYFLTVVPSLNINGAAISTVIAYGVSSVLNILIIDRLFEIELKYRDIIFRPLIAALGMGLVVQVSYMLLIKFLGSSITTLLSVAIGGIVYIVLLVITGGLKAEDIMLLPKGDRIVEKLNL